MLNLHGTDYDPAFELAKADELEGIRWPDELRKESGLNAGGEAYCLLFDPVPSEQPWPVDEVCYMTADEAAAAGVTVRTPVGAWVWNVAEKGGDGRTVEPMIKQLDQP